MYAFGNVRRILCAGLIVLAAHGVAFGGGLSTPLGEALIENLQVGNSYDLGDLAGLNLTVKNTCEAPVNLQMDVLLPADSELRRNAEPLPCASWVSLSRDQFGLRAAETATADILITLPDDDAFRGRTFQFIVWSHTIPDPDGGMALAYGLKSRIIFTTAAEPAPADDEASPVGSGGVTMSPAEIFVDHLDRGRPHDLAQSRGLVLEVTNPGDQVQTYAIESLTVAGSLASPTAGYEDPPDASYLTFGDPEFVLSPGETKQVKLFLEIPEQQEHEGKNYVFVIHASSTGGGVSSGIYSRLYASVY